MDTKSGSSHFIFWQRWLFYTSLFFASAGIVFALAGNSILFQPYTKLLAQAFWHSDELSAEANNFRSFVYGSFGATLACCYILLAFIARFPFKDKQPWARNVIIIAFGIWVIIDSSTCFRFGLWPQIYLINVFSILVKALPLIFTWKDFKITRQD